MMSRLQTNRSYFYLLLVGRIFVILLFLFLLFGPLGARVEILAVILLFLYQTMVLAVFCIRFLGPLRGIKKISEMIAEPERHMMDLKGGRPIHGLIQYVKQSVESGYISQMLASQAETHALQSQINPHFLYNTLDTIRSMTIIRGSGDIAQIAESLSMLFRHSISRLGEMVTLKGELDNMKNYLLIQGYRFPGKFKYQQKIEDGELLQYKLPVLTIQPVIENAIHHGLEIKAGEGRVSVYTYGTQERFIIRIAGNGMDMTEQQMDSLREGLAKERLIYEQNRGLKKRRNTGIALPNVDQKIKFYYRDDYGIRACSTADIGIIAEITLPAAADAKGSES